MQNHKVDLKVDVRLSAMPTHEFKDSILLIGFTEGTI